jgi:hypothetical protein
MCNLYSIATNQEEAICALFCMIDCYVGNLPPMPGVFPDYSGGELEMTMMRWSVRREREEAWR